MVVSLTISKTTEYEFDPEVWDRIVAFDMVVTDEGDLLTKLTFNIDPSNSQDQATLNEMIAGVISLTKDLREQL